MHNLITQMESEIAPFSKQRATTSLLYYANDLVDSIGLTRESELDDAMKRAFKICSTLDIPIDDNFSSVYRFNGTEMVPDWKLSALAAYLLVVNANPENSAVARAQLFFTLKNSGHVNI